MRPRYIAHSGGGGGGAMRRAESPHKYVPRERLLTDKEIANIWRAAGELGGYGVSVIKVLRQRAAQIKGGSGSSG